MLYSLLTALLLAAPPNGGLIDLSRSANAPAPPAVVQWDFDRDLSSSNGGATLSAERRAGEDRPEWRLEGAEIGGKEARVARFERGTYFRVPHSLIPKLQGSLLQHYTIIMDVRFDESTGKRPFSLMQSHSENITGAEWMVDERRRIGGSKVYGGEITLGRWHRLALVVDGTAGTITHYVDGTPVTEAKRTITDGPWALEPEVLIFADNHYDMTSGMINSLQLRDRALSAGEIAALGGADAAGIPMPPRPTLQVVQPARGQVVHVKDRVTIRWRARHPQGEVRIELARGRRTVRKLHTVPVHYGQYEWDVYPYVGDGTDYRIRMVWRGRAGDTAVYSEPFEIVGSLPQPNPHFGEELVDNGDFEMNLDGWQVLAGSPMAKPGGAAFSGDAYFFSNHDDVSVIQDIDLIERGFHPDEIDTGVMATLHAWLRTDQPVGKFDDQIFVRAHYLDGDGARLGGMRTLLGDDNVWQSRGGTGVVPRGTRKIRLEIVSRHRRGADNDGMVDAVSLRLDADWVRETTHITKLPMLQDVRQDAMTLLWETTSNAVEHRIDWGRDDISDNVLSAVETTQINPSLYMHRATIEGLTAETEYVYRVQSGDAQTPEYRFKTAPKKGSPLRIAWLADNQNGWVIFKKIMKKVAETKPNLAFFAGDIVQHGDKRREWHTHWWGPLSTSGLGQTVPVVFARGNHDGEFALAYAYSALPGNEAWFAFNYGNIRFIVLDTEATDKMSPRQHRWLQKELASDDAANATFRIVVLHKPPFSNLWDRDVYQGDKWVRTAWVPLFEKHNVDMVIAGHAHSYQRATRGNTHYIVVGGAGGRLDTTVSGDWNFMTHAKAQFHYNIMDIDGDTMKWVSYGLGGEVLDEFSMTGQPLTKK